MSTAARKWREGKPPIIDPRLELWTRGKGTIFQTMEAFVSAWETKTGKEGIRTAWGTTSGAIGASHEIRERLAQINLQHDHGYGPPVGYVNFREVIAQKLSGEIRKTISRDDIFVCAGATGAMEIIVKYAIHKKSAVFLPELTYPPFLTLIDQKIVLGGGKAYYYKIREDGQPDTADLKRQIDRARNEGNEPAFIYVNTPNNPTAEIYTPKILREIKTIAKDSEAVLITDDVYFKLTRGKHRAIHLAQLLTDKDVGRVPIILLWSLSKEFGMAGDRIGGPCFINCEGKEQMQKLKFAFQTDLGVKLGSSVVPQQLADEILNPTHLPRLNEELGRRDEAVRASFGLKIKKTFATIYAWAALPDGFHDSYKFSIGLAENMGVSVTPGITFWRGEGEPPPYIRIALTESPERLTEGGERVQKFMKMHENAFR